MPYETDFLDGFVFAHGNVIERARARFGPDYVYQYDGAGKRNGQPRRRSMNSEECAWIRKETDLYNEEVEKYLELKARKRKLEQKVGKAMNLGPREFTLTYSPQWGWDDTEARSHMSRAIERLCRYYSSQIVELRAIGEVCKDGKSHVHCFYSLQDGLKITDKNFTRAYPKWNTKVKHKNGHQGGHHATIKDEASFKAYIEKDLDSAWLDYLFSPPGA